MNSGRATNSLKYATLLFSSTWSAFGSVKTYPLPSSCTSCMKVLYSTGAGTRPGVRPKGRAVRQIGKVARILELIRQEERRRHIDAVDLRASRIGSALGDRIRPEVPSALVRLAVQKVEIMLTDKEPRVVIRIRRRRTVSLSRIVTSAVFGLPKLTLVPVGFESVRPIVSFPSTNLSSTIRTEKVFDVSPGLNVSVPTDIS